MKKLLTLLILSVTHFFANAQGEANKWFFGQGAALDFNSGSPVTIYPSPLYTTEGTAAMSDAAGNLKFFTNGVDVWDASKTLMPNGSGLMGDVSTTQSAMIVPNPASGSQYYVFTAGADGTGDFRYSIVDMTLNGGMGDVVVGSKNTFLTDSITEKVAAIRDGANGVWILTHKWGTAQYFSYHLTIAGLAAPIITNVGSIHIAGPVIQNSYGELKFNNCGTKMAAAIGYQDIVELFDFDLATGIPSNPMTFNLGAHVYGVEFSMTSTFMYVTNYAPTGTLAQYNISLPTFSAINASKVPLTTTPDLYGMQMGPDGKIYIAQSFGTPFMGVISNPEVAGFGCNFSDTGLNLDPGGNGVNGALGVPSFMQDYLRLAGGVLCPTTGIAESESENPSFVFPNPSSSEFSIDLTNAKAEVSVYNCMGKLIDSKTELNSVYTFGYGFSSGVYLVRVVFDGNVKTQTVIKK